MELFKDAGFATEGRPFCKRHFVPSDDLSKATIRPKFRKAAIRPKFQKAAIRPKFQKATIRLNCKK